MLGYIVGVNDNILAGAYSALKGTSGMPLYKIYDENICLAAIHVGGAVEHNRNWALPLTSPTFKSLYEEFKTAVEHEEFQPAHAEHEDL